MDAGSLPTDDGPSLVSPVTRVMLLETFAAHLATAFLHAYLCCKVSVFSSIAKVLAQHYE